MCRAESRSQVVGAERVDQRPVDVPLGEQGLDHHRGQPGEAAGRQREARTAAAAPEQLPGGVGRGEREQVRRELAGEPAADHRRHPRLVAGQRVQRVRADRRGDQLAAHEGHTGRVAAGVHGARAGRVLRPLKNLSHRGGLCESLVTCPTWRSVPFTPDETEAVRTSREILDEVAAADSPWDHPWLPDRYEMMLRQGWDGEPPAASWRRWGTGPSARPHLSLTERDNRHLAWLRLAIRPDERRRGYGSALFELMAEQARRAGRTSSAPTAGSPSATTAFAARHGLERRSQAINRRQHLAEVDPGPAQRLYDEAAALAADYELVRIVGPTPDELIEPMAEMTAAINDAPTDDLDIEDEVFTPERVRGYEEATIARGQRLYRLVARHRETGELGGHTVVAVEESARDRPTSTTPPSRGPTAGTGSACCSRPGCCSGWPRPSRSSRPSTPGTPSPTTT